MGMDMVVNGGVKLGENWEIYLKWLDMFLFFNGRSIGGFKLEV